MLIIFTALALLFAVAIFVTLSTMEGHSESGRAFRLLRKMITHDTHEADAAEMLSRYSLGRQLRSRVPWVNERILRPLLYAAGYYTEQQADVLALIWPVLILIALLLSVLLPGPAPLWFLVLLIAAVLGPQQYLRFVMRRRRVTVARGLPDVVDLLVICVEAGLGLDQSVIRVSEELADTHPEIKVELDRLMQHQRAGMPRLEAWQRMAERLSIPDVDAFVTMILQTERFGTPIARALSEFAALSRQKRTQVAEEAAAKTTVKISFPLILFIFPCIFIVLLGPALLNMLHSLAGYLH